MMSSMPRFGALLIAALIAAALQWTFLWGSTWPLGVPGEWTWDRIAYSPQHLFGWISCLLAGGVYLLVVLAGIRRLPHAGRWETAGWLGALVAVSACWLYTAVAAVPEPAGLGRIPFVLYYPKSSGYFWQARYEVDDLRSFLRGYRESIADPARPENYLHLGTHPPGLTAGYRLLWQACSSVPWLRNLLLATEPTPTRAAFAEIARNAQQSGIDIGAADEACLWLAALITWAAATLTVVPLFDLSRTVSGRADIGWGIAALWPLVPAVSVFFPKSDLLYPVLGMTAQCLWWQALARRSLTAGAVSGVILTLGMLLSLALLPVAALFGLQAVFELRQRNGLWKPVVGAFVGVGAVVSVVSLWGEMNLLAIWLQNVRNHAAFYDHNPRSYFAWLKVNPLELAGALGAPAAVVVMFGAWHGDWGRCSAAWRLSSVWMIWGLLWVSGKNMGEAARLWCFLMPLLLWTGAPAFARQSRLLSEEKDRTADRRSAVSEPGGEVLWALAALIILQMLVCAATVTRVDGFHLTPGE